MDSTKIEEKTVYKITPIMGVLLVLVALMIASAGAVFLLIAFVLALEGSWLVASLTMLTAALILAVSVFVGSLGGVILATRIALQSDGVRFVLPTWRGPTPLPPFRRGEIGYRDITAIETREEISHTLGLPFHSTAASLVTRSGDRVVLGYVLEYNKAHLLGIPFLEVAQRIAERAHLKVTGKGAIKAVENIVALKKARPPGTNRHPWSAKTRPAGRASVLRAGGASCGLSL